MRLFFSVFIASVLLFVISCRKEFNYAASNGKLRFSKDTVFLDTIFTGIGSSTYVLKVYNDRNEDIEIPSIKLEKENNSNYRINVDGIAGTSFNNIPLGARDSLFIFIETTYSIENSAKEFLHTDVLLFDEGTYQQKISLVTLIKDAIFIFPEKDIESQLKPLPLDAHESGEELLVNSFFLTTEQLNLTNEKPYVIYGYPMVPKGKKLLIEAGARLYFHKNSGLFITTNSSLEILGENSSDTLLLENEVILEGDRLEPEFDEIPGQWGGIYFEENSGSSTISHLTLKNAINGIVIKKSDTLDKTTLSLTDSRIYNSTNYNILAENCSIYSENIISAKAGKSSVYLKEGGNYEFIHATIANYWSFSFRTGFALEINQNIPSTNSFSLSFKNSIITGNDLDEIHLELEETTSNEFFFENCLIQFSREDSNDFPYDFTNKDRYRSLLVNENPAFVEPLSNNFKLHAESKVIDKGNPEILQRVPLDIIGNKRGEIPDLGAFEF